MGWINPNCAASSYQLLQKEAFWFVLWAYEKTSVSMKNSWPILYRRPSGLPGPPMSSPQSSRFMHWLKPCPRIGSHFPPFLGLMGTVLELSGIKATKGHLLSVVALSFLMTDVPKFRHRPQKSADLARRLQTRKWLRDSSCLPEIPTAAWLKGPGHPALTLARRRPCQVSREVGGGDG